MSSFNFGAPNTGQTNPPAFGAQASAPNAGFSFGLNSQPPAAPATANVTFGTPKPSGFNFGTPASMTSTPQQSAFGFPQAAVAPQPQASSLTSGLPQNTQAPTNTVQPLSSFAFSTPSQPTTGFSFGQQTAQTAAAPANMSFGLSNTPKPAGLTLGQPTSTPAPGFSLGQQPTQPAASGFSLGQQPTQPAASGFSFGQPSSTAATSVAPATLGFGLPTASVAGPSLTVNSMNTTTPSTGLSFGQPSAQAPLFGASQQTNLLSSLTGPSLLPTTSTASVPQTVGLGGIDMMNTAQPKATEGKSESTKVKEAQVPKEILQTIEDFKAYVKQQKTLSSDIIRTTDRKLKSVTDEIKRLNCTVQEVANNVDNNKLAIKLLRSDTSKIIQHADMAQRTHETPSGLQFENTMPQIYFNELIHKYENDLLTLKHQVELTEKHLQSLSHPQNFTAQDLKRGLQQIHESFIALAGRLQEAHTKVENQKEKYLELRKFVLRDSTNVFEQENQPSEPSVSKVQYGPNPFTSGSGLNQANSKQWPTIQQSKYTSFYGNNSIKRM